MRFWWISRWITLWISGDNSVETVDKSGKTPLYVIFHPYSSSRNAPGKGKDIHISTLRKNGDHLISRSIFGTLGAHEIFQTNHLFMLRRLGVLFKHLGSRLGCLFGCFSGYCQANIERMCECML